MSKKKKRSNRTREFLRFKRNRETAVPDHNDPYGPPQSICEVFCIHCGQRYWSDQIKWDPAEQLWVCRDWPNCSGAGFGVDIIEVTDEPGPWLNSY